MDQNMFPLTLVDEDFVVLTEIVWHGTIFPCGEKTKNVSKGADKIYDLAITPYRVLLKDCCMGNFGMSVCILWIFHIAWIALNLETRLAWSFFRAIPLPPAQY
jgi:hypothetical protein